MKNMTSVLVLPLVLASRMVAVSLQENSPKKSPSVPATASVQVSQILTSVKELHTRKSPNEATVVVQVAVLGDLPPHSTATVEIASYASTPPNNNLIYIKRQETLTLKGNRSPTTFFFKVRATPKKTVNGSIVIAAIIESVTKGIEMIRPTDPSVWRVDLKTVDP